LQAASTLASSGISPEGLEAFSNSTVPCNLRCTISGLAGDEVNDLADILLSFGASSTSISEHRADGEPEQEIMVDGKWTPKQLWDRCSLTALFPVEHDVAGTLRAARDALGREQDLEASVEEVLDEEWEAAIRASYKPFEVESGLWVVPQWCEAPDPAATNVLLEPGLAFGTGEHPTTRLCLSALRRRVAGGESVMDYGTGSGVLAIAALLLGAGAAVGTDTEPFSITAAGRNAAINGVADRLALFRCGSDLREPEPLKQAGHPLRQFDVVVANILQGPLLDLAPRLLGYLRPGGLLLLSGVTAEQAETIAQAYGSELESGSLWTEQLDSWALVGGIKCRDKGP